MAGSRAKRNISLRIGIHTSRSGSLEKAAVRAHELGANTFQIFSSSPRMWRPSILDPDDILRFRSARERYDLHPLVIHTNYLINLATSDPELRLRSIASFRAEIERAVAIGAEYLVTHPGNYKSCSPPEGVAGFALGVRDALADLETGPLTILIENTVGATSQLGGSFPELREMRNLLSRLCETPIAFCLDTCHLFASGWDLASAKGFSSMAAEAESVLGLANVRAIHANDSKGGRGSRLDRHANIGEGAIGLDGFARLLRSPAFRHKPFILETPVDAEGDDRRNLETLRRLAQRRPSTRAKKNSKRKD